MPTLILFNYFAENKELFIAVGAFLSGICTLLFPYLSQRRKLSAEIHKTDMDTVSIAIAKVLELMKAVEVAHKKSLEDEKKISDLESQVKKLNGH